MVDLLPGGVLQQLAARATAADAEQVWPDESWGVLASAGVLRWSIAPEYGGQGLDPPTLLSGYELLASACMTTCLILSQREAACRRIGLSGNVELCRELLPALAEGKCFATVGLSQLTTSRQYGPPALVAREQGGAFVLDGAMPWVTGASHADFFVTGAVLESPGHEARQILAVVPSSLPGITVGAPLDLMALQGSLTCGVRCESVVLDRKWLLAGPAAQVLAAGKTGPGGLETSSAALGLAGAAVAYLLQEASRRPDLDVTAERLDRARVALRGEMQDLARGGGTAEAAIHLRSKANSLVVRATQAALTASKGAGFLRSHPAQRWARQAMFFLVWSCPRPAADAMLAYLAPAGACDLLL